MQDFILLKRSIGYKYLAEVGTLKRFDRYLIKNCPELSTMTKEAILGWCAKTSYEKPVNQCSRASVIRQFCKYLDSIGRKTYILPKNYYVTGPQYVPYIYTKDELNRFFAETDNCKFCYEFPNRHLIMPIFYRLLFSCGLRCSEARLLKVKEVDLDTGILTITESKNHNSRLVPMPDSITKQMKDYFKIVHKLSNNEEYFFPFSKGKPMTVGNIYKNFRRFLWKAGISHTGEGLRVHDFRHSYAVYRLKTWSEQDRNLLALLPVLKTYLGHDSFYETSYYLRMTADVFPDIQLKLETAFAEIIPELEGEEYETD